MNLSACGYVLIMPLQFQNSHTELFNFRNAEIWANRGVILERCTNLNGQRSTLSAYCLWINQGKHTHTQKLVVQMHFKLIENTMKPKKKLLRRLLKVHVPHYEWHVKYLPENVRLHEPKTKPSTMHSLSLFHTLLFVRCQFIVSLMIFITFCSEREKKLNAAINYYYELLHHRHHHHHSHTMKFIENQTESVYNLWCIRNCIVDDHRFRSKCWSNA